MRPFNTFPHLLSLSFFVPIIFRIACAVMFVALARHHIRERQSIIELLSPLIGKHCGWVIQTLVALEVIVAVTLFIGWYTQIFAIAASILALKLAIVRPTSLSPFGRTNSLLILVMAISLIITGAGGIAFDIPL